MQSTTVICVCSPKGGVGKTTCSRMLGSCLKKKGHSVLFVDLVGLATLTKSLGAEPTESGAYSLLLDHRQTVTQSVTVTADNDAVVCGSASLDRLAVELNDTYEESQQAIILRAKLSAVDGHYDYIIIDTPTAVNSVHMNALVASDWVILAADPDEGSAEAVLQMHVSITEAQKVNPSLKVAGVLLSFADVKTSLTQVMMNKLNEVSMPIYGAGVFKTVIRRTVSMGEARLLKQDPVKYAPRSTAVKDYMTLTDELLQRIAPAKKPAEEPAEPKPKKKTKTKKV